MQLELLSAADDYCVAKGSTDPRGWRVLDADGSVIAEANDLIIDVDALTTRYIVCSTRSARKVLVPVGFARLNDEECTVHLDFITASDVEKLPTFDRLPLSTAFETEQEQALTGVERSTAESKIVRRNS